MKAVKKNSKPVVAASFAFEWWHGALCALGVFVCVLFVYSPALRGQFVFDDLHMPFADPDSYNFPLRTWWGVRPLLMTTYWLNLQFFGREPFTYHLVNVLFHACAGILFFFAVRKILELAHVEERKLSLLAGIVAAIFLLHPIQTEAVSYIAQRGEDMGALLYFAAFCVFLYRKPGPLSWSRTIAVLALFLAAVSTKEHTVTLPVLLLLTDYFWNPGFTFEGIKKNWRLYATVGAGLLGGVAFVWRYISLDASSIGFNLPDFTPAQYLFTQFRVFFAYIGLFVYPFWQTIDYDFPVSKNLLDHGSIVGLLLILFLTAMAFRYRRRFPLAAYGFFVFGLLLLPTSSIIPIKDPIVDRRLYLPVIGLLFVVLELLRRWKIGRNGMIAAASAVCLLLALGSYSRNQKWANAQTLWADAVDKNPDKQRVQFGLASSQSLAGHCRDAIPHYQRALALGKPDPEIYLDLGMAYDCEHQSGKAEEALQHAIDLKATAQAWTSLAFVKAKAGILDEALAALLKAEQLDSRYVLIYIYRGGIFQVIGRLNDAAEQYRRALAIEPANAAALRGLNSLGPAFTQSKN